MEQAKASSEDQSQHTINEAQTSRKQGGWITFPFIAGSTFGLGLAISGSTSNLIVYLIKEYNVKSIDAAQIVNIVNGCTTVSPVVGAIIADAYFGCYPVFAFASVINLVALMGSRSGIYIKWYWSCHLLMCIMVRLSIKSTPYGGTDPATYSYALW